MTAETPTERMSAALMHLASLRQRLAEQQRVAHNLSNALLVLMLELDVVTDALARLASSETETRTDERIS